MTCTDKPESSDQADEAAPTRRDFLGRISQLTVAGTAISAGVGVPADAAVCGNATEDPSFLGGTDTVTYRVDIRAAQRPVQFEVRLLHPSVGYHFIQDLGEDDTP